MKIKIEKEKYPSVIELSGSGNANFYGYLFIDCKRTGTIWRFNDGRYIANEDFNTRIHNRENRPRQFKGNTLAELKNTILASW